MKRGVSAKRSSAPRAPPIEHEGAVSLGPLAGLIGFNLRLAQDASFQVFAGHSGEPHLRPGRFAALMLIHTNPGLTQAQLGRAIGRDKSTVTPLVQGLQRDGLVERSPSQADRRRVTLRLTPAGDAALDALVARAIEHDRKLDAIVGSQKPELLRLLKRIADELT